MKKINYSKLNAGDLVEVPRTQFAPYRRGWNGWLFSNAVVIRKAVGVKTGKPMVVVSMCVPSNKVRNGYVEVEKSFYAECVFQTNSVKNAKEILEKVNIHTAEEYNDFIKQDDVTGCDWISFLVDKGFIF